MLPSNNNNFDFFKMNQNPMQQIQPDIQGESLQPVQVKNFFSHQIKENSSILSNPSNTSMPSIFQSSKKKYKMPTGGSKLKNSIQSEVKKKKSESIQEIFKSVLGEYEIIRALGKGSYGAVVKAIHRETGTPVAIKKYLNLFKDKIDTKRILREIAIIRRMDHPNIIQVYDIIIPDLVSLQEIFLVMELCDTDLKTLLYGNSNNLSENQVKKIMFDILIGLDYLHKSGGVHRDLKPANIMINLNSVCAKIADFGLARDLTLEYDTQTLVDLFLNYTKRDPLINYEEIRNYLMSSQTMPKEIQDILQENLEILQDELFKKFCNPSDKDIADTSDFKSGKLVLRPPNLLIEAEKDQILHNNKDYYSTYQNLMTKDSKLKKQMTQHVMTRWYRAPEIILFESFYANPVDIWAVGCIFAELLGKLPGNKSTGPLFPGTSCYPMSPMIIQNQSKTYIDITDQLVCIMRILGSPSLQELDFINNKNAKTYVLNLGYIPKQDFFEFYPGCSAECILLLLSFLTYDPRRRITINEAVNDKFFDGIRESIKLFTGLDYSVYKPSQICLEYEKDGCVHDFSELKELFLKEYEDFKKGKSGNLLNRKKMLEAAGLENPDTAQKYLDVEMK